MGTVGSTRATEGGLARQLRADEVSRDDHLVAVLALAQELCFRRTSGGHSLPAAHHADVARELRQRLPAMDQDTFDSHLARIDRIAAHISAAEARAAGLDVDDRSREAVIEHWDAELHAAVARLVDAERRAATRHMQSPSGGQRVGMTVRQVGVEEELLLVDTVTGETRPVARDLIAACGPVGGGTVEVKHEFFGSQVEVTSSPHAELGAIRDELAAARARLADVGTRYGVAPLAVAGPVQAAASRLPDELSPGDRYAAIERHYGDVARRSLMCAVHVHVDVADDEEGVAVIDRVRPWIPVLIAVGANSPFWHGSDSGYQSWRSRQWNMWPTSGPAEPFGSASAYHAAMGDMVSRGAALDLSLVNLDVRLSHRYPTVEFRAADVCTDLADAMLIAALARALVTHCADLWRAGSPREDWRVDELRAAAWRASRFGMGDTLVSPLTRDLTPAGDLLRQMAVVLADPLESAGDTALVANGLAALEERGNGATRQRQAFAGEGGMTSVVADLRARTARP